MDKLELLNRLVKVIKSPDCENKGVVASPDEIRIARCNGLIEAYEIFYGEKL